MGLSYRKSVKLPGGLRMNLSKRGPALSGGAKGVRYSSRTGLRLTLPGTGLTWRAGKKRK